MNCGEGDPEEHKKSITLRAQPNPFEIWLFSYLNLSQRLLRLRLYSLHQIR